MIWIKYRTLQSFCGIEPRRRKSVTYRNPPRPARQELRPAPAALVSEPMAGRPHPVRVLEALEELPEAWHRAGPRAIENDHVAIRLTLDHHRPDGVPDRWGTRTGQGRSPDTRA